MAISFNYNVSADFDTAAVRDNQKTIGAANTNVSKSNQDDQYGIIDFMEISLSGLFRAVKEYSEKTLSTDDKSDLFNEKKAYDSHVIHDLNTSNEEINYSKSNILDRVDESIAAQANSTNMNVLYLLQ